MVCTCAFPSQPSDYEHKDYERNATMYLKLNATQSLQKVKNLIQHYFRKLMFFHPFGIFNSVPRCVRITLKFSLTYSENFQWNSRQIEGVDATIFKQLYDNNTNARKSAKERERERFCNVAIISLITGFLTREEDKSFLLHQRWHFPRCSRARQTFPRMLQGFCNPIINNNLIQNDNYPPLSSPLPLNSLSLSLSLSLRV